MTGTRSTAKAAVPDAPAGRSRRPRGRPLLYTSYAQDMALLDTRAKKIWTGLLVLLALSLSVVLADRSLEVLAGAYVLAIGAIGLNIVTGYAGQVSLGHAFFVAIGAYTAAAVSGPRGGEHLGFGLAEIWIWLPAAGLVAALFGVLVAPLATRLRGLYLAVVTLGLVFLGEHVFKEWDHLTGGPGVGREAAVPQLFGLPLAQDGAATKEQQLYVLMLVLLIVFAVAARNLARSRIGRAFSAIRDRDIAAAVIGVPLTRYKVLAFGISSFYAGCAGALFYSISGYVEPGSFSLLLSVQFIAMVLIGGVATVSGAIAGALFISLLQPITRSLPELLPIVSADTTVTPNVFQVETVLYGLLIILFLVFEPRGLFGIWIRVRAYWKSWPFSY
ncbi:branched-chain amino acid ABC transporter permease [Nonomuraea sp. NPDC050394]|uniref:branched-chain amino acid ABC transporter permease n=1 Tax=Nonomuraea sp. NPDC050394 TaxID=3364363 RepID=UPI00378F60AE